MQCRDNMMRSFLLNETESIDFSTIKQDQSFPEIEVNQVGDNADPLMILYEKLLSWCEFFSLHFGEPDGIDGDEEHIFFALFLHLEIDLWVLFVF